MDSLKISIKNNYTFNDTITVVSKPDTNIVKIYNYLTDYSAPLWGLVGCIVLFTIVYAFKKTVTNIFVNTQQTQQTQPTQQTPPIKYNMGTSTYTEVGIEKVNKDFLAGKTVSEVSIKNEEL